MQPPTGELSPMAFLGGGVCRGRGRSPPPDASSDLDRPLHARRGRRWPIQAADASPSPLVTTKAMPSSQGEAHQSASIACPADAGFGATLVYDCKDRSHIKPKPHMTVLTPRATTQPFLRALCRRRRCARSGDRGEGDGRAGVHRSVRARAAGQGRAVHADRLHRHRRGPEVPPDGTLQTATEASRGGGGDAQVVQAARTKHGGHRHGRHALAGAH